MTDCGKLLSFLRGRRRLIVLLALLGMLLAAGARAWVPSLRAVYHLRAAQTALRSRAYDRAEVELVRHLDFRPDSGEGHFLLGQLARRSGRVARAGHHLRACRDLGYPGDALRLEWDLLHVQDGDFTGGVEGSLRRCLDQQHPDSFLILEALSQGYTKTYRLREARDCLDQMLDREPDNVYALVRRGWVLERLGHFDAARADYRCAATLQPGHGLARRRLAENLLYHGKNAAEAAEHFEALRRLQPDDGAAGVNLAQCRLEQGRVGEARALLDEVLATHPAEAPAFLERGKLALSDGQPEQSEVWLRRAVALQPSSLPANYSLFLCLSRQGKIAEAEQCRAGLRSLEADYKRLEMLLRRAGEEPLNAALRCEIGQLFLRFGEDQEGERWLLTALQVDPGWRPARQALADYYRRRGEGPSGAAERLAAVTP
jgi:Tfp pilus assembly protein PilF